MSAEQFMDEHKEEGKGKGPFSWQITSLERCSKFAQLVAKKCPPEQQKLIEVALNELIINAIEHGFLKISSKTKGELLKQGPDVWLNTIKYWLNVKYKIVLLSEEQELIQENS